MDRSNYSIITAAACLFILMSIAGCTTIPVETVKQAIEKRRQEQCQCELPQVPVIIIVEG